MKLSAVLILATVFVDIESRAQKRSKALQNGHKTAADFAKLIHLVNGHGAKEESLDDEDNEDLENYSDYKLFDLDYNGKNGKSSLTNPAMRLLQKNDKQRAQEDPEVRIHVIKNPGVVEKYKKSIKRPINLQQSSEETGFSKYNFKDFLMHQRRNAFFRLDSTVPVPIEKAQVMNSFRAIKNRIPNSQEDDKFDDFDKNILLDDYKRTDKKKNDFKQDNAWDVITTKYDWKEKERDNDRYDDPPKNNRQIKQKKISNMDDDWDRITKQDIDNWSRKTTKHKVFFDDRPKRDRKEKKKRSESVERYKQEKPKRVLNSGERRPEKSFNDRPMSGKKIKPKKEWDSFEMPKKKMDFNKNNERYKNKNRNVNWDTTPYTLATFRTTRERKREFKDDRNKIRNHPSYYNNPKPMKQRNSYGNSGFFGRTPIPYVGRQGIYADN